MDARVTSSTGSLSTYVQYEGTLTVDGTHYNITNIDGATTAKGSISYPLNTDFTSLNGQKVVVKGYFVGVSSSTYYNTLISSVEEYTDPTDSRIATTITQDDITLDIAEVATLTKITPVVKDADGNVISYVNSEFPPEVSFTVESDENGVIGGFDWNTGDITLNPIAGTATV
ncbi:MAG: hypothetical protein IKR91_04970, partial [Alloprevotella sp.]|nr:hypothetical protein [Alloprevotella sp.]